MEKVFTKSPYICAPNIMDHPDYVAKQMELVDTGADCIPAGSPINAAGQVANDETAIGILLQDCHTCLGAHRGMVVIEGRIKQDVAAEHSGITISDKAKAALVNISFTGDGERMGGSGSGSGLPTGGAPYQQLVTDGTGKATWEDKMIVDSELSDTSENPVQNKVVKAALDALAIPTLHITVTSLDTSTMETTFTADKTVDEMYAIFGPTLCVVTVPASVSPNGSEMVLECSSYKLGFTFGYGCVFNPDNNLSIDFAVNGMPDGWILNFKYLV